jgi:mono/diheme cytochrome c family protein
MMVWFHRDVPHVYRLAPPHGFEPRSPHSKCSVLPLDEGGTAFSPMRARRRTLAARRSILTEINAAAPYRQTLARRARGRLSREPQVKWRIRILSLAAACVATAAHAGDAEVGRQLAHSRCAPCHQVAPFGRDELATALPFEVIARKFPADGAGLIIALRGPHERMNFSPSFREADDIAEYIRSLTH